MKLSTTCFFVVATLSFHIIATNARRNCYNGGRAMFTNYWIPKQGGVDETDNGGKLHLSGPKTKPIKNSSGKIISFVDRNTWYKCDLEGTCVIELKGKPTLINLANNGGSGGRFELLGRDKPFGQGSHENALKPYTSVAANDLPFGTRLFVKELAGLKLPNGLTHNGCVSVDDGGWSFGGCQLDFFVLKFANFVSLNTPDLVTVKKKNCKILDYSTFIEYDFVGAFAPANAPKPHGRAGLRHADSVTPTAKATHASQATNTATSTASCGSGGTFVKSFGSTNFGGAETCSAGKGCHKLSGVTKSAKWPAGTQIKFYSSSDCSGDSLYVDSSGEDADISGNGDGFHAGSISIA